jgi:type I restriction enzyme S subunit
MQQLLQPKEGWEVKKLGEVSDLITKGTTPTSVGREFQNKGINFIKIESLQKNGEIVKDKVAFIDEFTHNLLQRSQLKSKDILFSIAGALGRVAIVKDEILPANTNQALAIIRLKDGYLVDYIYFYLNNEKIQKYILTISVQGAQANLSLLNISELDIPFPALEEQTRIASVLTDMDAELSALEQKLEKYKRVKLGMMQELLTGKTRLN